MECIFLGQKQNEFGAIFLNNGIISGCFFCDSIGYNGCNIGYNQSNFSELSIIGCTFENKNNSTMNGTLIYQHAENDITTTNVFINNSIIMNIKSYLFGGEIVDVNLIKLKFKFDGNCISPFDKKFFKSNRIVIYNENQSMMVPFKSVFKIDCKNLNIPQQISRVDDISIEKNLNKIYVLLLFILAS